MEETNFILTRDNILRHFKGGNSFRDLINGVSLNENFILFSEYVEEKVRDIDGNPTDEYINKDMNDIKSKWLKYCRILFPKMGMELEYRNPYKSGGLKDITEVEVYRDGEFKYSKEFANRLEAEVQSYIANHDNFCTTSSINFLNKELETAINSYNEIKNDDAGFVRSNNMVGAKASDYVRHNISTMFFHELMRHPKIFRDYKIAKLLDS